MCFAAAGASDQDEVGAIVYPAVAGTYRHDVRFGDLRHSIEVEAVDGFTRQQPRLTQMTLDTASIPLGYFMLGQRRKEAGGRPAFLVRAFGNGRPALLDRARKSPRLNSSH